MQDVIVYVQDKTVYLQDAIVFVQDGIVYVQDESVHVQDESVHVQDAIVRVQNAFVHVQDGSVHRFPDFVKDLLNEFICLESYKKNLLPIIFSGAGFLKKIDCIIIKIPSVIVF